MKLTLPIIRPAAAWRVSLRPAAAWFLGVILCAALLTGCAVLSDSQVKNINAFAATTKAYSSFPSAVVRQFADLHRENEILLATRFTNIDRVLQTLDSARSSTNQTLEKSAKFDLSLQVIQQYGALLATLSGDYTSGLGTTSTGLGVNLDTLVGQFNRVVGAQVPASLGSDLSKLILVVGQRLTKKKQTEALREFVIKADPLIQKATGALSEELDGMGTLLALEENNFTGDMRSLLKNDAAPGFDQPGISLTKHTVLSFYYAEITDYRTTEALRKQLIQAARSLATAHAALVKDVQTKKDLDAIIAEVKQLVSDVQPLGPIASKYVKLPLNL